MFQQYGSIIPAAGPPPWGECYNRGMEIIRNLRTRFLLTMHERSATPGSEDWMVCRIGSNRPVPETVWQDLDIDQVSYAVFSKVSAFASDRGFSKRQLASLQRLLDLKTASERFGNRTRITPALIRLVSANKWKACEGFLSLLNQSHLVSEAAHTLSTEFRELGELPPGSEAALSTLAWATHGCVAKGLDEWNKGWFPPGQETFTRQIQQFRWALETLDSHGHLDQEPKLLDKANETCSVLMLRLDQDNDWLPREDIKTIWSICRRAGLQLVADRALPQRASPPPKSKI